MSSGMACKGVEHVDSKVSVGWGAGPLDAGAFTNQARRPAIANDTKLQTLDSFHCDPGHVRKVDAREFPLSESGERLNQ